MNRETRWSLIEGAARGDEAARLEFARRYQAAVRSYLAARWRGTPLLVDLDDTAQEVFLQCFRDGGALERADPERGGFRAFLYGVVRRAAQKVETDRAREYRRRGDHSFHPEEVSADDTSLSRVFDRRWAQALIQQAGQLFLEEASAGGPDLRRRADLLHLRYRDRLPVREIARQWDGDPAELHHELSRAKDEFRSALCRVIAAQDGYAGQALDRECERVLQVLR